MGNADQTNALEKKRCKFAPDTRSPEILQVSWAIMLIYARIPQYRVMYNELIPALSPVQTVMIVDDSW